MPKKEKPTSGVVLRHRKLVKEVMENGGKISTAMRKVGYSNAYAKNPQKVTETKSWQELMEEYLPDTLIAEKHKALLEKKDGEDIDTNAVKAGVDMAYKLKKRYENPDQTIVFKKYEDMSDEELEQIINARINKTGKD